MDRTSIETRDVVKGLVIVDVDGKKDSVKIFVRESMNESIVSESEVNLTTEGFFRLVKDVYKSLGYKVPFVEEVD